MDIERSDESDRAAAREAELRALVDGLGVLQSSIAALSGLQARVLASVLELTDEATRSLPERVREHDLALRSVSAEVGAVLRVSDRTVQRRLSEAWQLTDGFPATHRALLDGRISPAHASAITDAGLPIDETDARARFEARALALAETETAPRLRALLSPIVEQLRATTIEQRHREARTARRVEVRDLADGMSELWALLPTVLAHGIHDRLSQLARSARDLERPAGDADAAPVGMSLPHTPGDPSDSESGAAPPPDPDRADAGHADVEHAETGSLMRGRLAPPWRTIDQIRADALCDLALGATPAATGDGLAAIRANVTVSVPVHTLAGITDTGAELVGRGAIDASTARALAGAASGWDRVMTRPVTGAVLAVDRYRPSEELRRTIRVRDRHCRFPGCRTRAARCDVDHTVDAAFGGATAACNLACLCRRHHVLKHHSQWTVRNDGTGVLTWTSPQGRVYVDIPPPSAVAFLPPAGPSAPPGTADPPF